MKAIFIVATAAVLLSIILLAVSSMKFFFPAESCDITESYSSEETVMNDEKINLLSSETASYHVDDLSLILQNPELPTGCEVTALTIILQYLGIEADKVTIARDYLPKEDIYRSEENEDILYGPDFRYKFPGDPENDSSFGCLAPCLTETAEKYIADTEHDFQVSDITGTSFYELFEYLIKDIPVIIWYTLGLAAPKYTTSWITSDGELIKWPTNEHCVVLSGYDYNTNTVQIYDPIDGVLTLNMEDVKERYNQIGKNAVVISSVK